MTRLRRREVLAALSVTALASACSHQDDVIVKTGADKKLTEGEIDSDPLRLLPGSAVGVIYLDARAAFASRYAEKLYALAQKRVPVPPSADFDPRRDLERAWVGIYSMQGADTAGVAVGRFDREKIETAADGVTLTPLGVPLTKSSYAGRALYTAGPTGFSVLTAKTALCGNDIGMRRALDRIEEGRTRRQLPPNMATLFVEPKAPLVAGVDLTASPLPDAARRQLAFLDGLKTMSLLGNFEDPGLNVAGTLSYEDEAAATRGAQNLLVLRGSVERYSTILALFGIGQPIRKLEAQPKGSEVSFVGAFDGVAVGALLERLDALVGSSG